MSDAGLAREVSPDGRPVLRPVELAPSSVSRAALAYARSVCAPLAVYVTSHVLLLFAFAVASKVVGGWPFPGDTSGWDGAWFREIEQHGYRYDPSSNEASNVAFFPLFPMVVHGFMGLFHKSWEITSAWVNFFAGAMFSVLFFKLAERLMGREKALPTTALMLFFPGCIAIAMAYSEAIGFALSAACLLALLDRRWLIAGVMAALATSTRFHAVALCFACAVAAFTAIRSQREWRSLLAPALAPFGLLGYFGYLWNKTGDPLVYFHAQSKGWAEASFPGMINVKNVIATVHHPLADWNIFLRTFFLGVVVLSVFFLWRFRKRLPLPLMVYAIASLILTVLSPYGPLPRLVAAAFPAFIAAGWLMRPMLLMTVVSAAQ